MRNCFSLIVLFAMFSFSARAQLPLTAQGKVLTMEDNQLTPLSGVTVTNQDGCYGAVTDNSGCYSIQVQHGHTHVFMRYEFAGYQTQTNDFGNYVRRSLPGSTVEFPDVVMEPDIVDCESIVIFYEE